MYSFDILYHTYVTPSLPFQQNRQHTMPPPPPPSLLPRHPSHLPLLRRYFSTTMAFLARSSSSQLSHTHASIPPYPYPPSRTYKQSNFGLYGGSHIQFGNKISSKNEIKTRRRWYPNIHKKRLWSECLGKFIEVKVQARVLRTIEKVGGLDEYLLGGKRARLKELGMGGWALRWTLWQTERVRERFRTERESLGVPEGGWEGLIRKMKREGKGRVVVSGRGGGARNEGCVEGKEEVKEEEEEEPSRDKAFMEESPLMKSLEQPPAESR